MALSVVTSLFLFVLIVLCYNVSALNNVRDTSSTASASTIAKPNVAMNIAIINETATNNTTSLGVDNNDPTSATNINVTKHNPHIISFTEHLNLDTGAVKRTFYVVVALTGVVLLYFTVKGLRMRRKRKTRRYGLLAEQELQPLDGDDEDEEDMTLFEVNRQKKKGRKP